MKSLFFLIIFLFLTTILCFASGQRIKEKLEEEKVNSNETVEILEGVERIIIQQENKNKEILILEQLIEPYIDQYGMPDKITETFISKANVLYQQVSLIWAQYDLIVKFYRKLTGEWKIREEFFDLELE